MDTSVDLACWGISELEDRSKDSSNINAKRKKRMKKNRTENPRLLDNIERYISLEYQKDKKEWVEQRNI